MVHVIQYYYFSNYLSTLGALIEEENNDHGVSRSETIVERAERRDEMRGDGSMEGEVVSLSMDTVFDILRNRRRRYALYRLNRSRNGVASFDEVIGFVVRTEPTDDRHERIARDLYERHLPRLAEANVIEYDDRSETIRYRYVPSLQEWLEHAEYKELGGYPGRTGNAQ